MIDKSITITISANDLSAAELDKARRSLAGFSDEAKRSRGSSDLAGGGFLSLGNLARQLTPALTVAGIVTFGKEILADADALVKLSDKTGIAIEPLQRLKYAAEQSGNTFEQITSAVSQMQKRIAGGDDSAVGALNQLGISVADFMAMTPDEQFKAIAAEVAKIEDPMQRVKVATDLFGKSGADVLPTLIANVTELGNAAPVMSAKATRAFDDVGDTIARTWSKAKIAVGEGLATMGDAYSRLAGILSNLGPRGSFKGLTDAMFDLETSLPKVAGAAPKLATATTGVALSMDAADKAGKALNETMEATGKQIKDATEAEKKYAEEAEKKARALEDQQKAQNELWSARTAGLQTLAGVTKHVTAIDETYADGLDAIGNAYNLVSEEMTWYGRATDEVAARTKEANQELMGLRGTMKSLADGLPSARVGLDGLFEQITEGSDDTDAAAKSWKNYKAWGLDALDGVSRVAEMAGHKTTAAVMSIASTTIKAFAQGGPVAGAIAGITAVFSAFADKIFKTEGRKVNDLRDAFFGAAGGFEALHTQLIAAGADNVFQRLWTAKTVKDWEAAVKDADAALGKLAETEGKIAELQAQLAGRQTMDWQRADELAQKYGGSLAGLGGQFEAAKLHAGFADLWNDWESLKDMGGDVGGMLSMMTDEIAALVKESARLGTEIPEQFRPMIASLIASGALFDENGEKITDIAGLKFGAPLVSEVDKIVLAIKDLIDTLKNGLNPAIAGIPRTVEIGVGYRYDPVRDPGGGGGEGDTYQYAAGGLVTSPRRAWIGEGGQPEIVGPVSFMARALAGAMARMGGAIGAGAASPQIVVQPRIYLDGRELTKGIAPWLPGEVKAYGLA